MSSSATQATPRQPTEQVRGGPARAMYAYAYDPRPEIVGSDPRRFFALVFTLAVNDFKLRFFGSVLGYLWSLMRPLLLFGVLYAIFTHVIRFGGDIKFYPVYLLTAIVMFNFFAEATNRCVTCLLESESLIRKVRFPRLAIPVSVVTSSLLNFLLALLAVFVFYAAQGVEPQLRWLEMPLLILVLALFALGCGMLLSVLYVRFRDVQPIWEVALQVLFYGSPVLYVLTVAPEAFQRKLLANPIACVLTEMRHAMIDPTAPDLFESIGSNWNLLVPAGILIGTLALGTYLFAREARTAAERL
ncbi:ABC transporter permease [Thermoleophilum album]|nr:ABC transporter permease [Thermoleophilum album]